MTDRELLKMAAKAAGLEVWRGSMPHERDRLFRAASSADGKVSGVEWNPLTDDGDALRLAVKLKIEVYEGVGDGPEAWAGYYMPGAVDRQRFCCEQHGRDPYAATRRAIVRAAAALADQEAHHG